MEVLCEKFTGSFNGSSHPGKTGRNLKEHLIRKLLAVWRKAFKQRTAGSLPVVSSNKTFEKRTRVETSDALNESAVFQLWLDLGSSFERRLNSERDSSISLFFQFTTKLGAEAPNL